MCIHDMVSDAFRASPSPLLPNTITSGPTLHPSPPKVRNERQKPFIRRRAVPCRLPREIETRCARRYAYRASHSQAGGPLDETHPPSAWRAVRTAHFPVTPPCACVMRMQLLRSGMPRRNITCRSMCALSRT